MTTEREMPAGIEPDANIGTGRRPPVIRRFGRRVYQFAAVLCLVAAVQAAILAAVGAAGAGRWFGFGAAAVLAYGGVALVVKSIPYEHVRFGGRAG